MLLHNNRQRRPVWRYDAAFARRLLRPLAVAAVAVAASACENAYPPDRVPSLSNASFGVADAAPAAPAPVTEYAIGTGDELLVNSFYHPELKQPVTVQTDGRVSLLLVGSVMAAGKTPQQLAEQLTRGYSKFLQNADVTVTVNTSAGLAVYVGGEVASPSVVPIRGQLSLLQSITAAGGFRLTANKEQVLILHQSNDGRFRTFQADATRVLSNEAPEIYLRQHDVVYVPQTAIAKVDQFVDQYINQIIPHAVNTVFGFQRTIGGGGSTVINSSSAVR